ncbi:hypothetical protein EWM64_g98 [Hericium alpestre]|uniref:Peptidase A1 domain-containing protein n=1 Tax=Hericium alpestre TaxID=135208 RepID=A0A4Z0A9Z2_9AGAM|nr:hypothetical protein EWM64_g98 [Hericium alpestre]
MQSSSLLQALVLSIYITRGVYALPAPSEARNVTARAPAASGPTIPLEWEGIGSIPRIAVPIGSGKTFQMVADTGSASFWVLSQSAAAQLTPARNGLDPTSNTVPNSAWDTSYGDGSLKVEGVIAKAPVTFAGQTSPDLPVGVVNSPGVFPSVTFLKVPYDGVFGFRPGTGPDADTKITTPFRAMVASKKIAPITGWKYPTSSSKGEITLGWVNPADFKAGTQVEVTSGSTEMWTATISSIKVADRVVQLAQPEVTALLDTGTFILRVPPTESIPLLSLIPGFQNLRGKMTIPCDMNAVVSFTIGGKVLTVQGSDLVGAPVSGAKCKPAVEEDASLDAGGWILGSTILHNWHLVFDETTTDTPKIQIAQASA